MAVKNRKRIERSAAQSLAKSRGGDRAAQFRLRDLAPARHPQTGTGIFDRPPMLRRAEVTTSKDREKKLLQYLDRAARRHEGAARGEKGSEASDRDDREGAGRRAV